MKKIFPLLLIFSFCLWIFMTWFFGFGGYSKIAGLMTRHPVLSRVLIVFNSRWYERWSQTMKIYDIFFLPFWKKDTGLPVYQLRINLGDYSFLNNNLPINVSGLSKRYKIPVEAIFFDSSGNEFKTRVRYRGDVYRHWSSSKKSWKIEKENGEVINLILPEERGYIEESLANYRAKKLGLMSQNDEFVWLKVNGKDMGVYFKTGHWDNNWLLNQGKPQSQLLGENSYDEGPLDFFSVWDGVQNWKYYIWRPDELYPNSRYIKSFLDVVNNTSDDLFLKELKNIVDIESLVSWQAHIVLMGNVHTDNLHNWRLWLDPGEKNFSFIPTDSTMAGVASQPEGEYRKIDYSNNHLNIRFLKTPVLKLMRDRLLWEYVKDDTELDDDYRYWDQLDAKFRRAFYKDRAKIMSNLEFSRSFKGRDFIGKRVAGIRSYLTYRSLKASISINQNGNSMIKVILDQPTAVRIEKILLNGEDLHISQVELHPKMVEGEGEEAGFMIAGQESIEFPVVCQEECEITVKTTNLVTGQQQEVSI